jgi:hypothetical protein
MPHLVELEETGHCDLDLRDQMSGGHQEWIQQYGPNVGVPNDSRACLPGGHQEQNTEQGMAFFGGVQPTVGQPSSSLWSPLQVLRFNNLNWVCM